jgi:hypothetical protein
VTGELDDEKRRTLITCGGYLVTKIFKRELWNDPVIRMREKVRCLEDTEILLYMILRARNIGNVKEVLYNYCDSADSATKTMDLDTYYASIYGAIGATYEKCHELENYEGVKDAMEYAMANMYSFGINRCLYEKIAKFGPDLKNVKKYFEGADPNTEKLLRDLADLRNEAITIPYDDNIEIQNRISQLDIAIMKECDRLFL